jgi:hypothetical protein
MDPAKPVLERRPQPGDPEYREWYIRERLKAEFSTKLEQLAGAEADAYVTRLTMEALSQENKKMERARLAEQLLVPIFQRIIEHLDGNDPPASWLPGIKIEMKEAFRQYKDALEDPPGG